MVVVWVEERSDARDELAGDFRDRLLLSEDDFAAAVDERDCGE